MRHLKEERQKKGRVPITSKIKDNTEEYIRIKAELSLGHLYWSYS